MKDKYLEAIRFFTDTNDKTQQAISIKEYQRFALFYYEKMVKYLMFDPSEIEDEIYSRLEEETKSSLSDRRIVKHIKMICRRKAANVLEDENVNTLNF